MTYYSGKHLADAFRTVRQNTIQTAQDIPEDKFHFAPADGTMTVATMLAHLAASTNFHFRLHGLDRKTELTFADFGGYMSQAQAIQGALTTKAQIIEALTARGEEFTHFLETLTDEQLGETVALPAGMQPPAKSRFEMLLGAKEHEMHHRGQLMIMQRMMGITPHLTRQRQAAAAARSAAPAPAASPAS